MVRLTRLEDRQDLRLNPLQGRRIVPKAAQHDLVGAGFDITAQIVLVFRHK